MFDQSIRRLTYDLDFRGYPGLLVRVRKPGYGALLDLADAQAVLGYGMQGSAVVGTARAKAMEPVIAAFAASLVSWTLADDGVPVPATVTGVFAQDYPFLVDLVLSWYHQVVLRAADADEPADTENTGQAAEDDAEAELEDALTEIPFTIGTPTPPADTDSDAVVFEATG